MIFANIASGSDGNCTFLSNGNTNILCDVGISRKRINEGLRSLKTDLSEIDGIVVSHEHIDHICGLKVIENNYDIPVYATKETIAELRLKVESKRDINYIPILPDKSFRIKDIIVVPFSISHDGINPVAYRFEYKDKAFGVCTDLGFFDEYIVSNLRGLDSVIVEANHDVRMLETGPYPYSLKRRIAGNEGHLSNETGGKLVSEILHDGMNKVVLGHLSKQNNYADLALEAVKYEINTSDNQYKASDFDILCAKHGEMTIIEK